jgi:GDPmannose 4,6-dehydratase
MPASIQIRMRAHPRKPAARRGDNAPVSATALITGVSGQDGSYLAELLHAKGYAVHGLVRSLAGPAADRVRGLLPFVRLVQGDLQDLGSLLQAVGETTPDEVYNLGALSSVARSWSQPELTAEITGLGTLRLLEAIRLAGLAGRVRFYQASSSEMFGRALTSPQDETTPFWPVHPYAMAKVFAHHTTVNFREVHGMFAVAGIVFNHESPRRGEEFVTRKICRGVARIALGLEERLVLGNLDARRDWGYAPEYVEAMWLMLQQDRPDDYVVATGVTHSVRDWAEEAFRVIGVEDWARHVDRDPDLLRPTDITELRGDASRAAVALGWAPRTGFRDLVRIMVEAEMDRERAAFHEAGRAGA